MNEQIVIDILNYIEENLCNGLKVESIANEFHFDRSYLSRCFRKYTKISLIDYINERRIIKSIDMLMNTDEKLLKIALVNGFNSLEYFSEKFYRITSFNPSSFKVNDEVKKYLPFIFENDLLKTLGINHEKIICINKIDKPKTKTLGIYK